mmetsp:Transcript_75736/g.216887  ORF Transcript_75736/g.216887 Transcript_75736/m.216887 type:complete len:315 (+) Transcript_75736:105-1049(+)
MARPNLGNAFGPSFRSQNRLLPMGGDVQDEPEPEGSGGCTGSGQGLRESTPGTVSPNSTSAGSGHSPRNGASPYGGADMLSHSYPVPVMVKNTFIDLTPGPSLSLVGFFVERATVSCPGSGLEPGARPQVSTVEDSRADEGAAYYGQKSQPSGMEYPWPPGTAYSYELPPGCSEVGEVYAQPILPPGVWGPACPPPPHDMSHFSFPGSQLAPLPPPPAQIPSPPGAPPRTWPRTDATVALPTQSQGSSSHASGHCKPCAFFHTKGCASGEECSFCHLCDEGEKKRRSMDKRQERADRRERRAKPSDTSSWFTRR